MTNNEVLIDLQKVFDLNSAKIFEIYSILSSDITQAQIESWFKRPSEASFVEIADVELATFLNALICERRGKREGPQPEPEKEISNNIVFKKLKIALDLKNEAIVEIFKTVDISMNNYELTSFFRKPNHKNYRSIKDQVLRSFFKGLNKLAATTKF